MARVSISTKDFRHGRTGEAGQFAAEEGQYLKDSINVVANGKGLLRPVGGVKRNLTLNFDFQKHDRVVPFTIQGTQYFFVYDPLFYVKFRTLHDSGTGDFVVNRVPFLRESNFTASDIGISGDYLKYSLENFRLLNLTQAQEDKDFGPLETDGGQHRFPYASHKYWTERLQSDNVENILNDNFFSATLTTRREKFEDFYSRITPLFKDLVTTTSYFNRHIILDKDGNVLEAKCLRFLISECFSGDGKPNEFISFRFSEFINDPFKYREENLREGTGSYEAVERFNDVLFYDPKGILPTLRWGAYWPKATNKSDENPEGFEAIDVRPFENDVFALTEYRCLYGKVFDADGVTSTSFNDLTARRIQEIPKVWFNSTLTEREFDSYSSRVSEINISRLSTFVGTPPVARDAAEPGTDDSLPTTRSETPDFWDVEKLDFFESPYARVFNRSERVNFREFDKSSLSGIRYLASSDTDSNVPSGRNKRLVNPIICTMDGRAIWERKEVAYDPSAVLKGIPGTVTGHGDKPIYGITFDFFMNLPPLRLDTGERRVNLYEVPNEVQVDSALSTALANAYLNPILTKQTVELATSARQSRKVAFHYYFIASVVESVACNQIFYFWEATLARTGENTITGDLSFVLNRTDAGRVSFDGEVVLPGGNIKAGDTLNVWFKSPHLHFPWQYPTGIYPGTVAVNRPVLRGNILAGDVIAPVLLTDSGPIDSITLQGAAASSAFNLPQAFVTNELVGMGTNPYPGLGWAQEKTVFFGAMPNTDEIVVSSTERLKATIGGSEQEADLLVLNITRDYNLFNALALHNPEEPILDNAFRTRFSLKGGGSILWMLEPFGGDPGTVFFGHTRGEITVKGLNTEAINNPSVLTDVPFTSIPPIFLYRDRYMTNKQLDDVLYNRFVEGYAGRRQYSTMGLFANEMRRLGGIKKLLSFRETGYIVAHAGNFLFACLIDQRTDSRGWYKLRTNTTIDSAFNLNEELVVKSGNSFFVWDLYGDTPYNIPGVDPYISPIDSDAYILDAEAFAMDGPSASTQARGELKGEFNARVFQRTERQASASELDVRGDTVTFDYLQNGTKQVASLAFKAKDGEPLNFFISKYRLIVGE